MVVDTATTDIHLALAIVNYATIHAADITQIVRLKHCIVLNVNATASACINALTRLRAISLESNLIRFSCQLKRSAHGISIGFDCYLQSKNDDRLVQQCALSMSTAALAGGKTGCGCTSKQASKQYKGFTP